MDFEACWVLKVYIYDYKAIYLEKKSQEEQGGGVICLEQKIQVELKYLPLQLFKKDKSKYNNKKIRHESLKLRRHSNLFKDQSL